MKCVWRVILLFSFALSGLSRGADPRIDRIERFGPGGFTLHFDSEPNRAYELQFTTALALGTNGTASTNWHRLYFVPSVPEIGHYVILDLGSKTNVHRVYRLAVTP